MKKKFVNRSENGIATLLNVLFEKDINRVIKYLYIYNTLPMVMVVLIAIIGVVNSVVLHHLYCIHFLR